jgi:hypothetical protein
MPYVLQNICENNIKYIINSNVIEALEETPPNPVASNLMEDFSVASNLPYLTIASIRYSDYFSVIDNADVIRFRELISRWHKERGITSSFTKMVLCHSYQEIIGMGPAAILLILRQLKDEGDKPDLWFWALESLTGENPVPEENIGDFHAMAHAWLMWGRDRYAELASG